MRIGLTGEQHQIQSLLSGKIRLREVKDIAAWAANSVSNKDFLWELSLKEDRRTSVNSLWVMTHFDPEDSLWLDLKQEELTSRLLDEDDVTKKRIYLQLLRERSFNHEAPLTLRLLDYCFSKINSECEPYAIRCFSIYVAFKISRPYPELIKELELYLNLLTTQTLSPGLRSGLRQTLQKIRRLRTKVAKQNT